MIERTPSEAIAVDILKLLATREGAEIADVLSGLSMALATIAVEAGMEEEKAIYAFRKSFGMAQRRLKRVLKGVH